MDAVCECRVAVDATRAQQAVRRGSSGGWWRTVGGALHAAAAAQRPDVRAVLRTVAEQPSLCMPARCRRACVATVCRMLAVGGGRVLAQRRRDDRMVGRSPGHTLDMSCTLVHRAVHSTRRVAHSRPSCRAYPPLCHALSPVMLHSPVRCVAHSRPSCCALPSSRCVLPPVAMRTPVRRVAYSRS